MRSSAPLHVLVLLLVVAFTLPTVCAAVAVRSVCTAAGERTGGSHGSHCPGSLPASPQPRACCQVNHGTPMTVPAARLVVSLNVSDHVAILNSDQTAPSKLLALIT